MGVEQGVVKPGEEVIFLPTHTASNPCTGKVFTVEMHHSRVDFANPGDNVGLNIRAWIRTTCLVLATSWFTRRTPLLAKLVSSMLRSKCLIFQMKSRWATHQLALCDAVALLVAFLNSNGRWERKQAVRRWRTHIL